MLRKGLRRQAGPVHFHGFTLHYSPRELPPAVFSELPPLHTCQPWQISTNLACSASMALLAWRGLRLEGWLWDEGEAQRVPHATSTGQAGTGALGNERLSNLGSDPPARWQHRTPGSVCKWQSTKQADAELIKGWGTDQATGSGHLKEGSGGRCSRGPAPPIRAHRLTAIGVGTFKGDIDREVPHQRLPYILALGCYL